ncbi:MAG TPA: bifunctional proline dehydrogenase/L-glutamate gamma-semialdehyde dehydrogenase PutA [Patescibacteria group bacterium]|nr:bifunctional proline dehydrogenase/L-glutamate gamma-semialdehyde dehydrogenase PutA [Patescibacteria group bacterium]
MTASQRITNAMPAKDSRKLSDYLYADEAQRVDALLASLPWDDGRARRVQEAAQKLIERVRKAKRKTGELESFLRQYGLDTEEGIALMTLAEALLRIPDARTADALIRDKMKAAEWFTKQQDDGPKDFLVRAAGFGLALTRKTLDSALSKVGEPVIRKAMVEAMRMLGKQFVLGRTIEEGIENSILWQKKDCRFSYDMLGEGARTMADADRYFGEYRHAIETVGKTPATARRSGVSVKLSALHPRYEFKHTDICVPALTEKLGELARLAADKNVTLTVDAEEADRLKISLQIIEAVFAQQKYEDWEGFGLAIQGYQKRCLPLIGRLADVAAAQKRRLQVRLVKGAYWDTEIKRAQVQGLPEYPVFTRKANTDLSYLACAKALLDRRDVFFPMLATHNAHTIAAVVELAGTQRDGFEFQRLHGMGETLYDQVIADNLAPVCIYAPCGTHEDLLPYLVRRLLENGANSSFVNKLLDPATPAAELAADPVANARNHKLKRHSHIPLPKDLYGSERRNSTGLDLADADTTGDLLAGMKRADTKTYEAAPLIGGKVYKKGPSKQVIAPADKTRTLGQVWEADEQLIEQAFTTAKQGFAEWNAESADTRATALEKFGDLMEKNRVELMNIISREGGKTLDDALSEVREAIDFCRYYAMRGRADFSPDGHKLPGPTGESNTLYLSGRGVFVCISPWNFPLAIFTGQITAALMAGNAVIAKPASPTPLIAMRAVQLMHEAGISGNVINLLPAGGRLGGHMVAHKDCAGVAFTGSTQVGWQINRALAAKDAAIAPLIAETGGQNAMIVDSSALSEQVIDDVILSAFGSAGQRCSALRVLYLQEEVADKMIKMLQGAMAQRKLGDGSLLTTDTGPIIDNKSRDEFEAHRTWLEKNGKFIAAVPLSDELKNKGSFFPPIAYEIGSIKQLDREIFGPVLHVVRYKAENLDRVIDDINATGFGLTLGVHSRISSTQMHVAQNVRAGNAYVNRSMIGAVVGVQPFGGQGLSGTGPKAGGPHYLPRFGTEKVISIDTARQGGNATLLSLKE